MKRRDFIKSAATVVAALSVPAIATGNSAGLLQATPRHRPMLVPMLSDGTGYYIDMSAAFRDTAGTMPAKEGDRVALIKASPL